jgi:hypothetical protein
LQKKIKSFSELLNNFCNFEIFKESRLKILDLQGIFSQNFSSLADSDEFSTIAQENSDVFQKKSHWKIFEFSKFGLQSISIQ